MWYITNTQDESKSLLVPVIQICERITNNRLVPMRAKDAQHTATVK
ncbi:hypothetical protein NXW38_21600 [Bacteroides ovatus]|nr:hypothetical protein [Bacteroides ovatus]